MEMKLKPIAGKLITHLVALDAIVVGQLDDKMRTLRAIAHHGLTPAIVIRSIKDRLSNADNYQSIMAHTIHTHYILRRSPP